MNYPAAPSLVACGGLSAIRSGTPSTDFGSRSPNSSGRAAPIIVRSPSALLTDAFREARRFLNLFALVKPSKQASRVVTVLRSPTRPFVCSVVVHVQKHEPRSLLCPSIVLKR